MARIIKVTLTFDDGSTRELGEAESARWMEWIGGHVDWDQLPETSDGGGATRFAWNETPGA